MCVNGNHLLENTLPKKGYTVAEMPESETTMTFNQGDLQLRYLNGCATDCFSRIELVTVNSSKQFDWTLTYSKRVSATDDQVAMSKAVIDLPSCQITN